MLSPARGAGSDGRAFGASAARAWASRDGGGCGFARAVTWRLGQEMRRRGLTKAKLAELIYTSRAQMDRILQAKRNVTIEHLPRAAALVGRD